MKLQLFLAKNQKITTYDWKHLINEMKWLVTGDSACDGENESITSFGKKLVNFTKGSLPCVLPGVPNRVWGENK